VSISFPTNSSSPPSFDATALHPFAGEEERRRRRGMVGGRSPASPSEAMTRKSSGGTSTGDGRAV